MSKTLLYAAILAILGVSIYFFIFKKSDSPFSASEAGFKIKDTASIGKIFLASNEGESITVERKAGEWILNGKMKALPSMVDLVMNTMASQGALYPVTKNAFDNVVKTLSTDGIKVELYDRDNKKMCAFYVGGSAVNGVGTNMMMEGASTPYVVQTPAFTGNLRLRYSTSVKDWRDRTVFNVPPAQIKSVSVQYLQKPLNSFTLTKDQNGIVIKGDPQVTTAVGPQNTNRTNVYINYFTNVNCEGYLNGIEGMDTVIKNTVKMSTIDVESINGTHQHADIYWMPINKRSKNKLTTDDDVPDEYDADRLYAIINDSKDTVMVQTQSFLKILRSSFEFFQKDIPKPAQNGQPKNVLIKDKKFNPANMKRSN